MQINGTLRRIIPICSMLLALGTVAFQNIESIGDEQQNDIIKQQKARKSKLDSEFSENNI